MDLNSDGKLLSEAREPSPAPEKAKKPVKHNSAALASIVIFSNLGSVLFGYEIGATVWILYCFQQYGNADDNNADYLYYRFTYNHSLLMGFVAAATAFGAVLCYSLLLRLADNISKKDEILLASSMYFVASLLISISSELTWSSALPLIILIIGKFIYGGGIASTLHSIPQYITEIMPADIRGRYGSSVEFMVMLGLNIGFFTGYINYSSGVGANWIVSFRIAYIIALVMAIAALFIPHNPVWLLYHDAPDDEVLQALQFITPSADEQDLEQLKASVGEERRLKVAIDERLLEYQREKPNNWVIRSGIYDLLTPTLKLIAHDRLYRRCLVVKFTYNIFKILSGQAVFLYFSMTIFTDLGVPRPQDFVFGYFGARLVMAFAMLWLAEELGRRDFLLLSAGLMALFLYLAAAITGHWLYATVAMLFLSGIAFQVGFGSMAYFVLNEITPFYIRSTANAVANIILFAAYFFVTFLFPTMLNYMGFVGVFLFFAICNTIALYYIYFYIPETRKMDLEKCYRGIDDMCDRAPDLSFLFTWCQSNCCPVQKDMYFDDQVNVEESKALVPERQKEKDWSF